MLARLVASIRDWFSRNGAGYRSWGQRFLLATTTSMVVVALLVAGGLTFAYSEASDINRVDVSSELRQATEREPGAPQNFLIVGTDTAAGLDPDDPTLWGREDLVNSENTDTIMILRVDPAKGTAAILSFPRDLYLDVGGRPARINTAIASGGPDLLIETIRENFQIPIDHYLQVDFAGFKSLVDEVGGVPVYFPEAVRDEHTGLFVPLAGCTVLEGDMALNYVRSRHYARNIDGKWIEDPASDLGRISRQQDFIRRALKKGIASGWRDPGRLVSLVDIAQDNVTLDATITNGDLLDLAKAFRGFNPDELELFQVPVTEGYAGEAAILRLDKKAAQPILDIFRGAASLDGLADSDVAPVVEVLNGTGLEGQAKQAASDLAEVGITVTGTGSAESFDYAVTTVRYGPGQEAAALAVARRLPGSPALLADPELDDGIVVLVTGADYSGVLAAARPTTDFQGFVDQVRAEQEAAAAAAAEAAASTTTTLIGEVPPEAPSEAQCR